MRSAFSIIININETPMRMRKTKRVQTRSYSNQYTLFNVCFMNTICVKKKKSLWTTKMDFRMSLNQRGLFLFSVDMTRRRFLSPCAAIFVY